MKSDCSIKPVGTLRMTKAPVLRLNLFRFILLVTLLSLSYFSMAQPADTIPGRDTVRIIQIIQANNWKQLTTDSGKVLQVLSGKAMVQHENTLLSGDSIVCDLEAGLAEVFGNVHINDGDTVNTYADYLKYTGQNKTAFLKKNVKINDKKGTIYANELIYDIGTGVASYTGGGRVTSGRTVITSTNAVYYSNSNDVYFKKNVKLKDPRYDIVSDSLLYNTQLQTATFIAPTRIKNKDGSIIDTRSGTYNMKDGQARFLDRTSYRDSTRFLIGERIAYDEKTSVLQIENNGKVVDSVNKVIVIGNQILMNKKNQTFFASRKPVMIFYNKSDSTYVSADTIFSGLKQKDGEVKKDTLVKSKKNKKENITKAADSIRYFMAHHNVRIFNDSLQAVCDSLYYSSEDSMFRLYYDPVFWNGNSQVSGDTIYLQTENRKPEKLQVIDNAMIINRTTEGFFNQAGGRKINALFIDGNIDNARVSGSPAESVYYPQDDDSAYVGLNRSSGDVIDVFFQNKQLNKIVFVNNVNGTLYPLNQVTEAIKSLKNFKWLDNRRPKNKLELFE